MTSKKIWHLHSNRWNSAITEYALQTALALKLKGCENYFSPLEGSPAEKRALSYGLSITSFKNFSPWQILKCLVFLREIKPDFIFVYGGPESFLSKLFPRSYKVVRFFGQDIPYKRWSHSYNFAYSHIFKFIVPNQILQNKLESWKFPKTKIKKIQLGIQDEKFDRDSLSSGQKLRPEILLLGRLDPVKGHYQAFEIFAQLKKQWNLSHPFPLLHVVGEPANLQKSDLLQMLRTVKLREQEDVKFTMIRVPHIESLIKESQIGWISSLGSEQICRVAEEFLLSGVAVFVSGAGATEEVLFGDIAGSSYKNLSTEFAAQKLMLLIEKILVETTSDRVGRRQKSRELFSLSSMGEQLYGQIVKE